MLTPIFPQKTYLAENLKMNLDTLIAVSGIAGIHKVLTTRSNGLIIEDLSTGKNRFISSRKHQFTPLESISIYTDDGESTELSKVFDAMHEQLKSNPIPSDLNDSNGLKEYFEKILPKYDRDRVHNSDIKKAIKWFVFLQEKDLLIPGEKETEKKVDDSSKEEKETEKKEAKTAKKKPAAEKKTTGKKEKAK